MSYATLLTLDEAAALLRLRPSTVADYARRGLLPSVRIGRHRRFVEADLTAWLDRLREVDGGRQRPL